MREVMTEDRQASCAERIGAHLDSRAADVRKMLAARSGETICRNCGQVIDDRADGVWVHGLHDDDALVESICADGQHTAEPDGDYTEDSLYDFGLGLSRKVVLRFDMSTGGPADWLEIVCDEETSQYGSRLDVETVTYHFADWWDHAEQDITDGPLFELAEWLAEAQP